MYEKTSQFSKAVVFEIFNICGTLVSRSEFSRNPCKLNVYCLGEKKMKKNFLKHTPLIIEIKYLHTFMKNKISLVVYTENTPGSEY